MASKSTNIQWLDTLRALATLGVIVIHISSPLVNMTYGRNLNYWWIGNVVDSAVRFAVPLFLMLSGATLLGKNYTLSEYYRRRFMRVLVPFLFWMVVYWFYKWITLKTSQQPHNFESIIQWAAKLFLKEGISKHFWYIYMILFIYLFVPFLGKWLQKLNLSALSNLLLLWAVLSFALKSIPLNMYNWSGDYASRLLGYCLLSGYLVLGYYLSKLPKPSGKVRISAALVFIISIAISSGSTYFFSQKAHKLDLSMYSYMSVNTIIQSIALFLWVKDVEFKNKIVTTIQNTLSNYSYGIYLVHIMIIGILFQKGIYWKFTHPLLSLPLLTVFVVACSFLIIFVLRKIPGGKYISG
jgi:surface polysaccharide O-acyltransferase-like enzyme